MHSVTLGCESSSSHLRLHRDTSDQTPSCGYTGILISVPICGHIPQGSVKRTTLGAASRLLSFLCVANLRKVTGSFRRTDGCHTNGTNARGRNPSSRIAVARSQRDTINSGARATPCLSLRLPGASEVKIGRDSFGSHNISQKPPVAFFRILERAPLVEN